jgi:hypothetical protein
MKKTLIALAAVAVTSTAMAQVTMSGEAGFAYVNDEVKSVTTSGMAQTDGSITIAASDDLGGGMTLSASHTVDLKGRSAVTAENSTIAVGGAFGSVLLGAVNAGNGIIGLGGAGGVGRGMDNGVLLDGDTKVDLFQYTSPALMTGLNAFVNAADVGVAGAGAGAFQAVGMGVKYSAGPLSVSFDNTTYSGHAAAAATAAVIGSCLDSAGTTLSAMPATGCATGLTTNRAAVAGVTQAAVLAGQIDSRQRLSFSYDLGMAKVGYGTQTKQYAGTGVDNKQTVMGVSAPFGAFTVSLARSTNKNDGAATKTTGTDLGINYALSKRTALNLSSMKSKTTGAVSNTYTRLRLKTTF